MPSPLNQLGHCDRRPRIHIWPARDGASFSFGPTGRRISAASIEEAFGAAMHAVEHKPAVIIFEGAEGD